MAEETNMGSENKELAQEALEDIESSPAGESEQMVPLGTVTKLRTRAQQAEIEAATLRGQLSAYQASQAKQAPADKSPLDKEIERQAADGIDEDDMTISPAVMRAEKLYDKQIANQEAKASKKAELQTVQTISSTKAKALYKDWQDVCTVGGNLLTAGEILDLDNAGVDFGELAYHKCKAAIERANPVVKTAPTPSELEAEVKAKGKVPSQQEILSDLHIDAAIEAAMNL